MSIRLAAEADRDFEGPGTVQESIAMTNRREFLQTGASMSALPLTNGLLSPDASARGEGSTIPLCKAIFDDRYAEGRTFAEAIGRLGVPVHALKDGDVTDLWHRERDLLRRERPAAIAGTTQFGPMFVIEQLGKEHGMRVALRVEHRARSDETIAHVMTGPPETLALADHLRLQGVDWPVLMAALLTQCRTGGSAAVEYTMVMPGTEPVLSQTATREGETAPESVIHYYTPHAIREGHGVPWEGRLFSWVIASAALVPGRLVSTHA
jgi:hypothetical protein